MTKEKFYTILLLNENPKHGYELMRELEEKLGKKISASQVYPFLGILKKNKLIKNEKVEGRDKRVYKLTREGRKFVSNFIQKSSDLILIAIEPELTTCAHCGCKVFGDGHKELLRGKEFRFCCCYCAKSFREGYQT